MSPTATSATLSTASLRNIARTVAEIHQKKGAGERTIVAICGGSCTGKSTQLAAGLLSMLKDEAVVLSQDRFQMNAQFMSAPFTAYMGDHPLNFGIEESMNALTKLKRGEVVQMPNYQFGPLEDIPIEEVSPKPIMLFEGLYAAYGQLREICDLMIYIESPLYARMLRRIYRNTLERYRRTDVLPIVKRFLTSVTLAHKDLVKKQRNWTHWVIRSDFRFEELIQRYELQPLAQVQGPSERTLFLEGGVHLSLSGRDEDYLLIAFGNRPYLQIAIDEEMHDLLLKVDWESL